MRIEEITPPGAGNARGVGAEDSGNLTQKYSTNPAAEVKKSFRHCSICGSRFIPRRHNHSLCCQCWSYDQVGRAIESIRNLMAEVAA